MERAEQKREEEEPTIKRWKTKTQRPRNPIPKRAEAELKDALKQGHEMFTPANKLTEEQARDMTMEVVKQAGLQCQKQI